MRHFLIGLFVTACFTVLLPITATLVIIDVITEVGGGPSLFITGKICDFVRWMKNDVPVGKSRRGGPPKSKRTGIVRI
jgi:hypothetical protein